MIHTATIRSAYGFDQFETVFQKLSHEIAIEAVTHLNQGQCEIKIDGTNKFVSVETNKYTIVIHANRIGYSEKRKGKDQAYWSFDIEEKLYLTSNHRTKIGFNIYVEGQYDEQSGKYIEKGRREKEQKREEEIREFIEKLMAKSGIKPVPRFSLKTGPAR